MDALRASVVKLYVGNAHREKHCVRNSWLGLLKYLFMDKRARQSLEPQSTKHMPAAAVAKSARTPQPPPPARERTPAEALAEAEERMKRLPPEKAQLVRAARLIHKVRQTALSESDRERLRGLAEKAFREPGRSG